MAFYGANVAVQIGPITLRAHGEAGLSADELLMLLTAIALQYQAPAQGG